MVTSQFFSLHASKLQASSYACKNSTRKVVIRFQGQELNTAPRADVVPVASFVSEFDWRMVAPGLEKVSNATLRLPV